MHVVDEPPLPVDLDDGDPLAVLRLELRHAVYHLLPQREAELIARGRHNTAGRLTKMAARRGVERYFRRFYG